MKALSKDGLEEKARDLTDTVATMEAQLRVGKQKSHHAPLIAYTFFRFDQDKKVSITRRRWTNTYTSKAKKSQVMNRGTLERSLDGWLNTIMLY